MMNQKTPIVEKLSNVAKASFVDHPEPHHSWHKLQSIERHRRNILTRVEKPFWSILSHWDGTCIQVIVRESLFWLTLAIYIGIRVQARLSVPTFVQTLANGEINIIGGFLTFFLVFYVNQNHKRYFQLYDHAMACKGRIFDVATLAVNYLPKPVASRLVRYMNAAHAAGYVGLSKYYPSDTFFIEINKQLRLLTDTELSRMQEIDLDKGGSCNRELIAWCMKEIHMQHKRGVIDDQLAREFREQILKLRAAIGQLYNAADLPIPFFYVHFISLLTVLYLPLFAISSAYNAGTGDDVYWTADIVSGLVVVLQSIFVIGLRLLGQEMSDPFGDDHIDLSVIHFVMFNWRQSARVLESEFPANEATEAEENELASERIAVGEAWEKDKVKDVENNREELSEEELLISGEADTFTKDDDLGTENESDEAGHLMHRSTRAMETSS